MGVGRDSRPWIPPRLRRAEAVDFTPGFKRPITPPPLERERPRQHAAAEPAEEEPSEPGPAEEQRIREAVRAHRGD
jgi:hypothetical protein